MSGKREVDVTAHLRAGKAVKGHSRKIDVPSDISQLGPKTGPDPRFLLEELDPKTTIKDASGNTIDLTKTDTLSGLDFSNSKIDGIDFSSITKMENCNFSGANIRNASLENIEIHNCNFDEANMHDVVITNADIRNCSFSSGTIEAHFVSSRIADSGFQGSMFVTNHAFNEATFESCNFEQSTFYGKLIEDQGESFDWYETTFNKCGFYQAVIEDVQMEGGEISNCSFNSTEVVVASFNFVEIERMQSERSQWHGVSLCGTNMSGRFTGATWENVAIIDAKLKDLCLEDSQLAVSQFDNVSFENAQVKNCKVKRLAYKGRSFAEAQALLGVSEKQFEFMVLSEVIEVTNKTDGARVTSGFDPDLHHIPPWIDLKPVNT